MEKINLMQFRQNLPEYANLAKYKGQRFIITRNGKPVGAFVPVEDLEILENVKNQMNTENIELSPEKFISQ